MTRKVVFSPEARDDLFEIYRYIAEQGAPNAALGYVTRLEARCANLAAFAEQGLARDDVRPGLRLLGFERKTEIAFHITPMAVVIDRLFHGGQAIDLTDRVTPPPASPASPPPRPAHGSPRSRPWCRPAACG